MTCSALPRARKRHLVIKAGLGPRRSVSDSQLCPGWPLWPCSDCLEEQPAGVVAPRPISVQTSCPSQKHLLSSVSGWTRGAGASSSAGRAGEKVGHSWRQAEAQLGLGGPRVMCVNRGVLLPSSTLPSVNKQIPQTVGYFSELHLGLTCTVGFTYLCARPAGAPRPFPGAGNEGLLCYVTHSKGNGKERLCIIPCI